MTATSEKSDSLNLQNFFQEYRFFETERDAQKSSGVNDYSLLASVLDINDEVRLHSRFLYSILNPHGSHYQGSLFLELFLKEIGLDDDWINYENVIIAKERSGIDIHITDGHKHVIIENKLNANDQEKQVQRYIEHIVNSYNVDYANIVFIYLSKNRPEPSGYGLGDCKLSLCKTFIVMPNDKRIAYKNAHYKKHIIDWLDNAKKKTTRSINLHNALGEYKKVVMKSIDSYRSEVMNIKDFLTSESQMSPDEKLKIIFSIERELPDLYGHLLDKTMTIDVGKFMSNYPVEKIDDLQIPQLTNHLFTNGVGREVFERYHCHYSKDKARDIQKGSFWRITGGVYKDKLALILWMATYCLHVGVVPILKKPDDSFVFSEDVDFFNQCLKKISIDGKKLEEVRNKKPHPIPVFISWGNEPEKEISQMYDFNESRQGRTFSAIFKELGIGKNITPST